MNKEKRQLAVVMFTDMVGYTALMQENEVKARADRDHHRKIMERLVQKNGGIIQQYFGDGTMCTFNSAIESVRCAMEIQIEFQAEPKIPVRIGLHSGDIVYEKDGIYGDAVNVSSRIESISVPGSVLFSGKLYDEVKNHPEFKIKYIGEFNFKNIKRVIKVFALTNSSLQIPQNKDLKGKTINSIRKIAVLPFVNMSSDPENEYFSDGITEELLDAFTKVEGLQVISRTSAFAFKGKNIDIKEIGDQLGVDTILEGSVRKAGNKVRITAQLIDTANDKHLFSESYDRQLEDIFEIQNEIANKIAQKLTSHIGGIKTDKTLIKSPTDNLDAYNIYLKGIFYWKKWTPESITKAISLFEEAIELEPEFALSYSWLANCYVISGSRGIILPDLAYSKAKEYANKALELDGGLYDSYLSITMIKIFFEWDFDGAYKSIEKALELNSGVGDTHNVYSLYLTAVGKLNEAVKESELAVRMDPLFQPIISQLAYTYFLLERYDESIEQLDKILEIDSNYRSAIELKGLVYYMKGDQDKALTLLKHYRDLVGIKGKGLSTLGFLYGRMGRLEEALYCLKEVENRQKNESNTLLSIDLSIINFGIGDLDKAFFHLERAIDARLGGIIFMKYNPLMKDIRKDPRFKSLMERVNIVHKEQE